MHPLTPEGGKAEKLFGAFPRGSAERIDRIAARRGMTRSELMRIAVLQLVEAEESQEVAAQAS
jgi:metal-responsive CopG/Arc/MetJ family transcriptional regulator